jgi:phage tail-like protein
MGEPAVGYRFKVELQGIDLGVFTKVEGLGARYDVVSIKEGGENGFVRKLPGRIEYDDLKLTRPVDEKSGTLAVWFSGFQTAMRTRKPNVPIVASISALDANDEIVASWSILGVFPIRYSGPSFQAGSSNVLTETIELAHEGFWGAGAAVSAARGVV